MKSRRSYTAFVLILALTAFTAGVFAPELRAQGGLPELLSSLRPAGFAEELEPTPTYTRVLQLVRERFYGEVPSTDELTYAAIRGMLNTLDDPYTRFLDPSGYKELLTDNSGEFEGIGAVLLNQKTKDGYVQVIRPIPGGPAEKAGLRRKDSITHVDGKPVKAETTDKVIGRIKGKAGTSVRLTVERVGEPAPIQITIVRQAVEAEVVRSRMINGNIGYVTLDQFNHIADARLQTAVDDLKRKGAKALILDLRGNPGGLLESAVDITSRLLPPRKEVVIIVEPQNQQEVRRTHPGRNLVGGMPFVVLVNRTSASASEIVAGAVRDHKIGTVVGATTFGKGLVQTVVPLQDGSAAMITTAKYLTPTGKDINRGRDQRGGVEPDIAVEISEEQFIRGEDTQLQKAIEVLQAQLGERAAAAPRR